MKVNYMSLWESKTATELYTKILAITVILLFCFTSTTLVFAQNDDKVVIFHTEFGELTIELFSYAAPNTTENFLKLAESGFYDETIFHRIIKGFMIQGGDPNSKDSDQSKWGQGYAGYDLEAEFNNLVHERGIVSMARSTHPDSAGSQFFIVTSDSTFLDKQYTVFGEVTEGMEVADKIVNLPRDGNDCPEQEAKMLEVTVSE